MLVLLLSVTKLRVAAELYGRLYAWNILGESDEADITLMCHLMSVSNIKMPLIFCTLNNFPPPSVSLASRKTTGV